LWAATVPTTFVIVELEVGGGIRLVSSDERGRSHLVALLKVEPAGIAERPMRSGVAPPEGGGGSVAVGARFR
jgi:hypothetical protein